MERRHRSIDNVLQVINALQPTERETDGQTDRQAARSASRLGKTVTNGFRSWIVVFGTMLSSEGAATPSRQGTIREIIRFISLFIDAALVARSSSEVCCSESAKSQSMAESVGTNPTRSLR